MSHGNEDEQSEQETQKDADPGEESQASQTSPTREDERLDEAVAEIEEDPSRTPPDDMLRNIKGG
jgi:hypothetical protein